MTHKITLQVDNQILVQGMPLEAQRALMAMFTVDNPEYIKAIKYDRYTGDISKKLTFYQQLGRDVITFPRGAGRDIHNLLCQCGDVKIDDQRLKLPEIDAQFQGTLRTYQEKAVKDVLQKEFARLEAGTGSGKTIMALAVIAARKQPTLILCHTKELLYQWRDRIKTFLGVDAGLVGDGKFDIQPVTVAIVNTARKKTDDLKDYFGHIIVDECHRVPSSTFSEVVTAFPARYTLGLSATQYRNDGLDKLIGWYLGLHKTTVDRKMLTDIGAILKPEIISRETDFRYLYCDDYQDMVSALVEDQQRNNLIAKDIQNQAGNKGLSLVVSDRVEHLNQLAELTGGNHQILTGKTPKKKRREIVDALKDGSVKTLFSTLSLIGEGFDCPSMDALFLASPVKFKGRLQQVVGRVLRPSEGKQPKVYDYCDSKVGILKYQAKCRHKLYAEMQ